MIIDSNSKSKPNVKPLVLKEIMEQYADFPKYLR